MIAGLCNDTSKWAALAQHIGHNVQSIQEYCTNFIPNPSAMETVSKKTPAEILAGVKSGQFATLFSDMADLKFIVTAKPEYVAQRPGCTYIVIVLFHVSVVFMSIPCFHQPVDIVKVVTHWRGQIWRLGVGPRCLRT